VAARGRLMQSVPAGSMLSVPLPADTLASQLNGSLCIAAVNGTSLCTVSGPTDRIEALSAHLASEGGSCRGPSVSHAFPSGMMESILPAFAREVGGRGLRPPELPFVSNVTGTWITAAEATSPGYWVRHLREAVRFADGLGVLLDDPGNVLVEIGPGQTLSTLA